MIHAFDDREAPANPVGPNLHLAQIGGFISDEQVDRIRAIGDALERTSIKLYGKWDESRVKGQGSHFLHTDETGWVYDLMAEAAKQINQSFRFDLSGFYENFYYLRYDAPDGHFGWHIDQGHQTPAPRKLSLILQLSDPSEYDGGDFEVLVADKPATAQKGKGMLTAFPSYKIHRVTPVTRGTRRTLSMFAVGPSFR